MKKDDLGCFDKINQKIENNSHCLEYQSQDIINCFINYIDKYNKFNRTNIIIRNKALIPTNCYVRTIGNTLNVLIQELIEIIVNPLLTNEIIKIEININEKSYELLINFYIHQNKTRQSENKKKYLRLHRKLRLCKEIVNLLGGKLILSQNDQLVNKIDLSLAKSHYLSSQNEVNCGLLNKKNTFESGLVVKSYYSRVLTIISEKYSNQNFKSSHIAELMCVSLRTLQRKLKEEVDVTLNNILYKYRIHEAKKKLLRGYKISNVSLDCGFSSHSHFTKKFKHITGITATEFIKINNE